VPALKADRPFYNAVHSSVLKNAALRLSRAIRAHQRDKSQCGWPRFRHWKNAWFSLEYEEPGKGWSVEDGVLHVQFGKDADGNRLGVALGLVKPPKRVRQAKGVRIVKENGRYFAVFTLEERPVQKRSTQTDDQDVPVCVYIDPNSKNLGDGVGTDGAAFEIDNLPGLRDLDVRIDKLKRKRDRCRKHSQKVEFVRKDGSLHRHWVAARAWRRRDRAVKRLENVRREWIKQYLFATAHRLFDLYDVVGIGDWSPQNGDHGRGRTANRTLRGRHHLGMFRRVLQWVAEKRGRFAYVLDERGTTRTCNGSGHVVDGGLPPDVRAWTCSSCGAAHHRDENAA
jgi:putative transposase